MVLEYGTVVIHEDDGYRRLESPVLECVVQDYEVSFREFLMYALPCLFRCLHLIRIAEEVASLPS